MDRDWPEELTEFEAFLQQMGLVYQGSQVQARYGARMVRWGDANIVVCAGLDREYWLISVGDVVAWADRWYDVLLIRDLLFGQSDEGMSLRDQVEFVESNWPTIVDSFSPEQRDDTNARLALLKEERGRRVVAEIYRKYSWFGRLTRTWNCFIRKIKW
jgi:hypothetical protein